MITNEYKNKLATKQTNLMQPLRDFMREEFDVNLKVWHHIALEDQDKSVDNILPVIDKLDPWVLNSIF